MSKTQTKAKSLLGNKVSKFPKERLVTKENAKKKIREVVEAKKDKAKPETPTFKNGMFAGKLVDQFPVNLIKVDFAFNARKTYDPIALQELADSIKKNGQLQPVGISMTPEKDGRYKLLYGFRRFKAISEINKFPSIHVIPIMKNLGDEKDIANLLENVQRQDLNDQELAEAVNNLSVNYKFNYNQIAEKLGKNLDWVKKKAQRFNNTKELPEEIHMSLKDIPDAHINATTPLKVEQKTGIILGLGKEVKEYGRIKTSVREVKEQVEQLRKSNLRESENTHLFKTIPYEAEYLKYLSVVHELESFKNTLRNNKAEFMTLSREIRDMQRELSHLNIVHKSYLNSLNGVKYKTATKLYEELEVLIFDSTPCICPPSVDGEYYYEPHQVCPEDLTDENGVVPEVITFREIKDKLKDGQLFYVHTPRDNYISHNNPNVSFEPVFFKKCNDALNKEEEGK